MLTERRLAWEASATWVVRGRLALPRRVVQFEDLVGLRRESFDVREDWTEHVLDNRLAAPVDATVGHSLGLVPLDVRLHRGEDGVDVAAVKGVIHTADQLHVCLTHSPSNRPRRKGDPRSWACGRQPGDATARPSTWRRQSDAHGR